MDNLKEKYYRINLDWPNKAGKMNQLLAIQKRLIERIARKKNDTDTKELLLAVAEGHDVSTDLMNWMREMLTHVGGDSQALIEGSEVRNQLKWAQELNTELLDARNNRIDKILNDLRDGLIARQNKATA